MVPPDRDCGGVGWRRVRLPSRSKIKESIRDMAKVVSVFVFVFVFVVFDESMGLHSSVFRVEVVEVVISCSCSSFPSWSSATRAGG